MSEPANAAQIAYWNAGAGETWAQLQERMDNQLAPLGRRVMAELDLVAGQKVLDIGCGAGQTTLQLAEAVGHAGQVLGVDISHPMLEVARRRARTEGASNTSFLEADAQAHGFEPGAFDVVFSRFGVMFFSDPTAAFANIHSAMKPGGRLAFVCWRTPAESPVMTLPMAAAAPFLPPQPPPADPTAPGPFAFADPERVRRILSDAGFSEVAATPHDEKIGGGNLDQTLEVSLRVGPLGGLLRENPDKRDSVIAAVREALAVHEGPDGVKLNSATWIVTARA